MRIKLKENYESNTINLLKYMRSVGCLSSKLSRRAKRRLEKLRAEVQEGQPAEHEVSDDPMRDVLASISNADNIMLPTYGRGRGRGRGRGESRGRGRGRGRGRIVVGDVGNLLLYRILLNNLLLFIMMKNITQVYFLI